MARWGSGGVTNDEPALSSFLRLAACLCVPCIVQGGRREKKGCGVGCFTKSGRLDEAMGWVRWVHQKTPPPLWPVAERMAADVSFSFGASTPTGRRHSSIESLGIVKSSRWGDGSCYPPWWLARWRPPPFFMGGETRGAGTLLEDNAELLAAMGDVSKRLYPPPPFDAPFGLPWLGRGSLHGLFASLSLRVPSASLLSLGKEDGCDACWSSSQPDVG